MKRDRSSRMVDTAIARPDGAAGEAERPGMTVHATAEHSAPIARDVLLALYRQMVQIRKTEEQLVRAHQAGLVHGACHTYIGEEAVATGACAHLRADDPIFSTHRGH